MTVLTLFACAAFVVWGWIRAAVRRHGLHINRRRISGSELARLFLDQAGLVSTAVESENADPVLKGFRLKTKVAEGTTLQDLALAARSAVLWSRYPQGLLPADLILTRAVLGHILAVIFWGTLAAEICFDNRGAGVYWTGLIVAAWALRMGLRIYLEWELSRDAMAGFKQAANLEPDERVRMKKLFRLFLVEPAAEPIAELEGFLAWGGQWFRKRRESSL